MPSLYEVCVWVMPFPPENAVGTVDTTGSPNVYFTTDMLLESGDKNALLILQVMNYLDEVVEELDEINSNS